MSDDEKKAPSEESVPASDAPDDAATSSEAAPKGKKRKNKKQRSEAKDARAEGSEDEASGDPADDDAPDDAAKEAESKAEPNAESKPTEESKRPEPPPEAAPLPPIPRSQRIRGGVLAALGLLGTFLLMAHAEQLPHGALFGLVTLLVGVHGLLELTGLLREDPDARSWRDTVLSGLEGEATWQRPVVGGSLATAIVLIGAVGFGYEAMPVAIGLALAALVPAALRRPGLLVFVVVGFLYLPLLGTFSLWDPWETHYGEVAREMISRDDWISLWWAQENWFWSKPILIFWSEAFTLSALGVDCSPDANPAHPEWAIRLPVVMFSIAAVLVAYATIKRFFGARAGVLAALALATVPHFFFLAHQAITDMYLVANLVIAMCLLALAMATEPEAVGRRVRVLGRCWSGQALVAFLLLLVGLPQALYLISRNVRFFPTEGFAFVEDVFLYGSGGNPGGIGEGQVPGNPELRDTHPAVDGLLGQPFLQGLFWLVGLAIVVWWIRREARKQALLMVGFYVFCGLAFMGKTIPGLAIPGAVALFYLVASRRWDLLFEGRLRVAPGVLIALVIGMPWFVAMYVRHGTGFTDRLLVHDNFNRLAAGVHGDTGSVQYFLWQLGYALFPWVGLVPAAVLGWLWMRDRSSVDGPRPKTGPYRWRELPSDPESRAAWHRRETLTLFGLWFVTCFVLFSAMITKFHHYIFPAVPPAAILAGVFLDRLWGEDGEGDDWTRRLATAGALLAPVAWVLGLAGLWGDVRGVIPEDVPTAERQDWVLSHGWSAGAYVLVFVGAAVFAWSARWLYQHRLGAKEPTTALARNEDLSLSVAVGAGAMLVAFVGRDLAWATSAHPHGYERLIHLFVYNYGRPWPDHFDYRPILTGFALTSGLVFAALTFRWTRAAAARGMVGLSVLFCGWVLNVYMVDLAPHWGMRELFETYYDERSGPEEPVIAWQMNWKGENFYTGNRVFAFVDLDNAKIREWLGRNRGKTAYFVMEHSRVGSFRSVVSGREIEEVTDKRLNNKFVLLRIREL
ncbi:MAG: glycosyltransferase family 39 protein [Sandaracinus sp.]|nr:glycosyltransferase family 39 protein [Sandaracinus sp.]